MTAVPPEFFATDHTELDFCHGGHGVHGTGAFATEGTEGSMPWVGLWFSEERCLKRDAKDGALFPMFEHERCLRHYRAEFSGDVGEECVCEDVRKSPQEGWFLVVWDELVPDQYPTTGAENPGGLLQAGDRIWDDRHDEMQDYCIEAVGWKGECLSIHHLSVDGETQPIGPFFEPFDHGGCKVNRRDVHAWRDICQVLAGSRADDQQLFTRLRGEQLQ